MCTIVCIQFQPLRANAFINNMFANICSFRKNDPLCMAYHPYHFVGEVLLHPVYACILFRNFSVAMAWLVESLSSNPAA